MRGEDCRQTWPWPAGVLFVGAWLLASAHTRPGLVLAGMLLALLVSFLFRRVLPPRLSSGHRHSLRIRLRRAAWTVCFVPRFAWLVFRSGLHIARLALKADPDFWPGIVRVQGGLRNRPATALFAHLITLTPGTVAMDYDEEADELYVHLIDVASGDGDVDLQAGGAMRPWVRRMCR